MDLRAAPDRPPGSSIVGVAARAASRARRARIFHPVGEAFGADLVVEPGAPLLPELAGTWEATVRLSRGIGLPGWLPDFLGVAVRVHGPRGGEQDLLLVSAGRSFPVRHLLRPARDPARPVYSSLVRFEAPSGDRVTIGARAVDDGARRFDVLAVRSRGPWAVLGSLRLRDPLAAAAAEGLAFDPWRNAAVLRPVGVLNGFRRAAYPASQEGRGDAGRPLEDRAGSAPRA